MHFSAPRLRAFLALTASGPRRIRKQTRLVLERLEDRRLMAVFTVNSTANAGAGSLRQAIIDANAAAGADEIAFNLPGTGLRTIAPTTELPPITESVSIDGTTQPGFSGTPLVELAGTGMGVGKVGLRITGGSSTVRGLQISRFRAANNGTFASFGEGGFAIELAGLGGNLIAGNVIGSNAAGTVSRGNSAGIHVLNSPANTIGGTTIEDSNLISGNFVDGAGVPAAFGAGIVLDSAATTSNVILGNFIGTNASGTSPLNNGAGVIVSGAVNNLIGGEAAGSANVISGNAPLGIWLRQNAQGNRVQGNFLGTNATGTALVTRTGTSLDTAVNQVDVLLSEGSAGNTIGGTTSAARNVIAAQNVGVGLSGASVTNNVVVGNFIGVKASGTTALGSATLGGQGLVFSSPGNTIGGTTAGARNVIGGLALGMSVGRILPPSGLSTISPSPADLQGSVVIGNFFGVDAGGVNPLTIGGGIQVVDDAFGLLIGGDNPVSGNVIANSQTFGVRVTDGRLITIRANSIYNTAIAIDLNQALDANDDITAPTLLSVTDATAPDKTISGQFTGAANQTYIVDFYASPTAILGGASQGETLIASGPVTTNAQGLGTFSLTVPFPTGQPYASATITDSLGNTSEFSNTLPVPPAQSDLVVSVVPTSGSTASGFVGLALSYTFTVSNAGPNPAPNTVFTHALPASFAYQSATTTVGTATQSGGTVTANLGTLAVGSSATVVITVMPSQTGTFSVIGSAVANDIDPNPANSTATLPFTITNLPVDLLNVSQTATPSPVVLGSTLTYTVVVRNPSPIAANGVILTDILPLGLILDRVTTSQGQTFIAGNVVTASLGSIAPGGTATLTMLVRPTTSGLLINTATVTSANPDTDPSNNTSSLTTLVEPSGPRVTAVQRLGFHNRTTRLVVSFNEPLNPGTAQRVANYNLQALSSSGLGFKPVGRVKIRSAVYDPVLNRITLTINKTLPLRRAYRLTVIGASSAGITNPEGVLLDGAGNGSRGTNYVTTLLGYNVIDIRSPTNASAVKAGKRG